MLTPEEQQAAFWQAFLDIFPPHAPRPETYETWYFGDRRALANELGVLVLQGVKTATCGALWEYEQEGERLPRAGEFSLVTDFDGHPLCIIQTISVEVKPFNQVNARFAYEEGEDDRTLESWRAAHQRFFTRSLEKYGLEPGDNMPLVCERFRLVYPLQTRAAGPAS